MRTFDTFRVGELVGSVMISAGAAEYSQWYELFPESAPQESTVPPGLVVSLMMRGYMQILGERPQGNVHASQELEWRAPAPRDNALVVSLKCARKELKEGRRWLWLENTVATADGLICLKGTMRMLWAA